MATRTERRVLPLSLQQAFALVADVEKYPQFVPFVRSVSIVSRNGNALVVDMLVGLGPIQRKVRSDAVLVAPERIDIVSTDWPFRRFNLQWRLEPAPAGGTVAELSGTFEIASAVIARLVDRHAGNMVPMMVAAFERRAAEVARNAAP